MKLAITHLKKVPGAEDYSSKGFGCSLEFEVPDQEVREPQTLRAYLAQLYDEARQAVEEQVRSVPRRNGSPAAPPSIFHRPVSQGSETNGSRPASTGNGAQTATSKQVNYLISLGARNKLDFPMLQRIAQERFQVEDHYRLNRAQASQLIDEMKPAGSRS